MKKIFLLLSLFSPVFVLAQEKAQVDHVRVVKPVSSIIRQILPELQDVEPKVKQLSDYENFDRYYYEYALQYLSRDFSKRYLAVIKESRASMYATSITASEYQRYENLYYNKRMELRREKSLSFGESLIIEEYESRPTTRTKMLENPRAYKEYEKLVYENILNQLETEHAKAYLEQVKVFREAFFDREPNMIAAYADLRYVLDKSHGKQYPDMMTEAERDLIEEYLAMQVSVNGGGLNIPLEVYFNTFRKNLSLRQRRDYPHAHYK